MNSPSTTAPPVPFAQRLTWGAGSLATISYLNVFTALALYYLTLVLKMDPALAGLLITLARLIDAFSDPLMGWVTDHTHTPMGRRRPYLLLGAVICGASLPAVFSMHTLFGGLPPAWGAVMIVLVFYSLGFTIFNVPYLTIPVEMTRNRIQRLSLMSYRSAFMMVGAMLGAAGAPALVEVLGGDTDADAYQTMGLMFGGLVIVFMLIPFFGTRGAYAAPLEAQPSLSLWQQVRTVAANRPFVLLIGAKCTQFIALAVTGGTSVFMFTVVLKQPFTLLPWLALASTFTILAGIPFWKWCGQFMTKRRGVLIGLPPAWGAVMIVLVFYSLGFTIFNVPYLTIPVEMTRNRIQRLSLMSYRSAFMMVGAMLGAAGAPALVEVLGGDTDADAYQTMGLMFGGLVIVFMLIPFFGTRGAYAAPLEAQPSLSLWQQVRTVAANRPFVLLIGAKCTQFIALAVTGGTSVFMFTVVLKQPFTLLPWLALASTFTILAGIPFWKWCGQFMTKRRGVLIGAAGEALASLTWLLATPDWTRETLIVFLVARGIVGGFFGSAILLYSQAMWLDTIDYDQERTGLRREGLYTSVYVFVERLGYSAGPLLVGLFLGASGFDANLAPENQPASAVTAVLICMVAIPTIAQLGMLFFVWRYRLPEIIDGKTKI